MKKSLLALAVLSAFAGVASAQNNVTVYGVVDAGLNFANSTKESGRWALSSGQQSGSRIGFKGTEDLGGGLSAVFTLENGFNTDDGTLGNGGRLFGRQAWVGLNGGFGSVKLGRQYSTIYNSLNAIDPFGINQAGNLQRAYGFGLALADPISRSDNTITYTTNNLGGFTGQVGYGFGEQAGNFAARRNFFAGVAYAAGPVNLQVAYQNANNVTVGGQAALSGGLALIPGVTTGTGSAAAAAKVETGLVGATYDLGVVKAHALVGESRLENTIGTAEAKIRNYMLGVTVPVGSVGSLYASVNRADVRDRDEGAADVVAVGYSHSLSKRTNFYTSVGYTRNEDRVGLNTTLPGTALTAGSPAREFQVGVRHTF